MYVVAIHNLPERKENRAGALSGALGLTNYEALSRLRVPGRGPFVVAAVADLKPAEEIAGKLNAAGFSVVLLSQDEIETGRKRIVVRKFRFADRELHIESGTGEHLVVDCSGIGIILRGTCSESITETETGKERKFSPGMAVLTSGLIMTKSIKTTRQTTTEKREGFLYLWSGDRAAIKFRESVLEYTSLGPALQPTRAANFSYVIAEVRRRCRGALYDDRLVSRAAQAQLLGPVLTPEEHLDIATFLLVKALSGRR